MDYPTPHFGKKFNDLTFSFVGAFAAVPGSTQHATKAAQRFGKICKG